MKDTFTMFHFIFFANAVEDHGRTFFLPSLAACTQTANQTAKQISLLPAPFSSLNHFFPPFLIPPSILNSIPMYFLLSYYLSHTFSIATLLQTIFVRRFEDNQHFSHKNPNLSLFSFPLHYMLYPSTTC